MYWCVLWSWKYIIIDFVAICQKSIYILSSSCMNMNLMGIWFDRNLPPLLLFFTIFEWMYIPTLYDDSNELLNTVQLVVSKVLTFHENTELFPSGDIFWHIYR